MELVLIKCLNDTNFNQADLLFSYPYKGEYIPTGHRGMGVTFDADSLNRIQ